MTWKTVNGERVLGPKEGALFFNFFDTWWDQYEGVDDDPFTPDNAEPFHSLSAAQKQTVVEEVLVHLLSETKTVPELTAANESCIWSIFDYGMNQFEDVDMEEIYGEGVLDALRELGHKVGTGKEGVKGATEKELGGENSMEEDGESSDEEDGFWPYLGCNDERKWRTGIECLADSILWDRDWELPDVQANPELMAFMRIDPGYFRKPKAKRGALARVEAIRCKKIAEDNAKAKEEGRSPFDNWEQQK